MSTKKKSANTAKQVSAQKKIAELNSQVDALKKECKEEREKGIEMFRIFREKNRQVHELTEKLAKSKQWADLRNDQVGKLIDIMSDNSQNQSNGVMVGHVLAKGIAELVKTESFQELVSQIKK